MRTVLLLILLAPACRNKDDSAAGADSGTVDTEPVVVDGDGDGSPADVDCDDDDPAVYPGATEACNDADDDCDDRVDENPSDAGTWYHDADGDSFGDPDAAEESCEGSGDLVADATDCDDGDAAVNPDADELCNGLDDNCDGSTDGADAVDPRTQYADQDSDGWGDPATEQTACDFDPGTPWTETVGDCDDTDPAISPAGTEVCNGVDDDCNGWTDEEDPGLTDAETWWADADSDGFGGSSFSADACEAPTGYATDSDDCDDLAADINPDADEVCNGVDDDCNGDTDEDDLGLVDALAWYGDADGDGYGLASDAVDACEQPSGYASTVEDCDDDDATVHPDASEQCDAVDHDCDGDAGLDSCTDCAALQAADSTRITGVHTIDLDGEGGQDAFDVACELDTDGGGWTLFWWKDEVDTMSGVTDVLAGDLWDCDPSTDTRCMSTMPITGPTELLVSNGFGDWAVWAFDGTDTSNNALAAFTLASTTSTGAACGDAWTPVAQDGGMTDDPYHCDETNNDGGDDCDCFWYDDYSGVTSFYLDDDTGWAETAFGAGYDNSGSFGVDSLETEYRYHDTTYGLWLYWR